MNFIEQIQADNRIVLASGSPRRQHLLSSIGMQFEIIVPDIDETSIQLQAPGSYCVALAISKANATCSKLGNSILPTIIIAADTIVVKDNTIIGKPQSTEDAIETLHNLSGECHSVFTGVAIFYTKTQQILCDYAETIVHFRKLSEAEILSYVASGKPMDKAGSYGIQDDYGALFVKRIEGCFYNVVGLPLELTFELLRKTLTFAC